MRRALVGGRRAARVLLIAIALVIARHSAAPPPAPAPGREGAVLSARVASMSKTQRISTSRPPSTEGWVLGAGAWRRCATRIAVDLLTASPAAPTMSEIDYL